MNSWLETLGVVVLAVASGGAGYAVSCLPRRWWLVGYIVPFAFVAVIGLCQWFNVFNLLPPFSGIVLKRNHALPDKE